MYNYSLNACGAVHITVGDAGNSEGLSFLDAPKKHLCTLPHLQLDNCLLVS